MSKKMVKIMSVILMAILMLGFMAMPVSADVLDPKRFNGKSDATLTGKADTIAGAIISVVQVVGIAVAIIMLIIVAIKYITAAPSDKAEVKKHLLVYVIGAVVLFASTGILQFIKTVAGTWFTTT